MILAILLPRYKKSHKRVEEVPFTFFYNPSIKQILHPSFINSCVNQDKKASILKFDIVPENLNTQSFHLGTRMGKKCGSL